MTGWRVGFAVGDPEIIGAMAKVISQTTSNLTTVSQYAAIKALTGDQSSIEIMRQAFEERLNTIYPLLNEVPGFEAIKPQGAFYLFPNVKEGHGDEGLYGCDGIYHCNFRRSRGCFSNGSWLWCP